AEKKQELVKYLNKNYRGYISIDDAINALLNRDTKTLLPTEFILALVKWEETGSTPFLIAPYQEDLCWTIIFIVQHIAACCRNTRLVTSSWNKGKLPALKNGSQQGSQQADRKLAICLFFFSTKKQPIRLQKFKI
ncbi:MAG: hypothetical protein V1655_02445, partial [bacterium]